MTVKYTATVMIMAREQQEVFEVFGDLVEFCSDLANSHSTAEIFVKELDPSKLRYSNE